MEGGGGGGGEGREDAREEAAGATVLLQGGGGLRRAVEVPCQHSLQAPGWPQLSLSLISTQAR
eukprot:3012673-Rhodomonas_salina.1